MNTKAPFWTLFLPFIAVLIWSINIVITRYVTDYIAPMSISFYRWALAWLLLTPFMLPLVWKIRNQIRPHLFQLAVLSAFGMLLYQGLAYTAAHYTTATNMGIINAFIPMFTLVVAMIVLRERPHQFAIVGGFISLAGLIYVIGQGSLSVILSLAIHLGDVLMLLAVFFYACYGVFLKKWSLTLPIMVSLYVQVSFSVIYHLPFLAYLGLDPIDLKNIGSIVYAGLFPSILAPLVWMLAVQHLGPNRTSIFMNLIPVITALIAYVWLKEMWTTAHTWGGLMILVGIFIAQIKPKTSKSV